MERTAEAPTQLRFVRENVCFTYLFFFLKRFVSQMKRAPMNTQMYLRHIPAKGLQK